MSNSSALIKDSLLPLNRNNKLLESRKSTSNLLKGFSSPTPSLRSIARSTSGSTTSKKTKNHTNYSREKSLLSSWVASTAAGGSDNSSNCSSDSNSSVASTPSTTGNIEALTKQVAALEVELKDRSQKLETANERLSDRELEISILQKRLELRTSSLNKNGGGENSSIGDLLKCSRCTRKDGLISCLFEKVNLYESAILGTSPCNDNNDVKHWDLDVIFRNVGELNKLVAENERTVEYDGDSGAKFLPTNVMHLTFYADGIQLDRGRFRSYTEKATKAFMKDLSDGFFPSELQVTFPNGVIFMVDDRRTTHKSSRRYTSRPDETTSKKAFQGIGHRLETNGGTCSFHPLSSRSSSSSSSSRPISGTGAVAAAGASQVMASPKKKCSKDLHKHNHQSSRSKMTSANVACGKASQKCFLKVHGIGDAPFLMELVAYDTIKTVRSLLGNVLKNEFIKHNSTSLPASSSNHNEFKLFTGFPRRSLNDDSKSLGDLGLVPNGVLHLVRTATILL